MPIPTMCSASGAAEPVKVSEIDSSRPSILAEAERHRAELVGTGERLDREPDAADGDAGLLGRLVVDDAARRHLLAVVVQLDAFDRSADIARVTIT